MNIHKSNIRSPFELFFLTFICHETVKYDAHIVLTTACIKNHAVSYTYKKILIVTTVRIFLCANDESSTNIHSSNISFTNIRSPFELVFSAKGTKNNGVYSFFAPKVLIGSLRGCTPPNKRGTLLPQSDEGAAWR